MAGTSSWSGAPVNSGVAEKARVLSSGIITRPGVDPVNVPGRPLLPPLKHGVEAVTAVGAAGSTVDLLVEH